MPFVSRAQAKWAFATKQPWARKWGHKTRLAGGIDKLPQYVARKNRKWGKRRVVAQKEVPSATPAIGNASGPGGLFSAAGLQKAGTNAVLRRSHENRSLRRQRPEVTYKEGEGHTGSMIALFLSPSAGITVGAAAGRMFGEQSESIDNLHITLAYLGKITDPGFDDKLPQVMVAVQRYTRLWLEMVGMPLIATLRGYSSFPNAQDDGKIPIYRVVDSPLLLLWVDGLRQVLDSVGVTTHREFELYTPHVTVAYSYPELSKIVETAPAALVPVQFDKVTVAIGDTYIDLPLAVSTYKANTSDNPVIPAKKPPTIGQKPGSSSIDASGGGGSLPAGVTRIRGNLCSVHGKFGPCDGASSEGFNKKPKKPKAAKGGKGAGAKPKLSAEEKHAQHQAEVEQRRAEAEAQKVQNRADALGALSSRPNDQAMGVLDALRKGGQPDSAMLKSMESTGLVEKHSDGSYTLSANGHGLLDALDKGDAGRAAEALAKGKDQIASSTERTNARAQSIQDRIAAKLERQQSLQKRAEARQSRTIQRSKRRADKRKKDKERGASQHRSSSKVPALSTPSAPKDAATSGSPQQPSVAPVTRTTPTQITPITPEKDRRASGSSNKPVLPGKRR